MKERLNAGLMVVWCVMWDDFCYDYIVAATRDEALSLAKVPPDARGVSAVVGGEKLQRRMAEFNTEVK